MANVLSEEKRQQVVALGQLGWSLRSIEERLGVRRETASAYLKAAGVPVRPARTRRPPPKPASEGEVSTEGDAKILDAPHHRVGLRASVTGHDNEPRRSVAGKETRRLLWVVPAPVVEFRRRGVGVLGGALHLFEAGAVVEREGNVSGYADTPAHLARRWSDSY